MATNFNSPFNESHFVDLESGELTKAGTLAGLRLPDGKILVNMHSNTSQELLNKFSKLFGAEQVLVKGTWVFQPTVEREEENGSED